ncbi:antibiotic biosynthesis monooxygenase family protein [Kitasatospora sp. NPDC001119]
MSNLSIDPDHGLFTTINIFHTSPENQGRLLDTLVEGMALLDREPGFVGTAVHSSHDGTKVVAYVQWHSKQAFEATRGRSDTQGHFARVGQIVTAVDSIACGVTETYTRRSLSFEHAVES